MDGPTCELSIHASCFPRSNTVSARDLVAATVPSASKSIDSSDSKKFQMRSFIGLGRFCNFNGYDKPLVETERICCALRSLQRTFRAKVTRNPGTKSRVRFQRGQGGCRSGVAPDF